MRHISPPKTQDVHKLLQIIDLAKIIGTIDRAPTTMDKDLITIAPTIDHIRQTIETIDLLLLIGTIENIPKVGITKGTIRLQPITIGLLLRDGIIKLHPKGRIHHIWILDKTLLDPVKGLIRHTEMARQGTIGIPRTPGIGLHLPHIGKGKGKLAIRQIETIGLQIEQILPSTEGEIAILPMTQGLKVVLNAALLSFIMNINVQNILYGQKEDVHVAILDFI